ncbi:hypothetical protein GCM10010341_51540 [Streptomyces noursei]|nr:hypothetical protein GCM10010341_51540 [Streptomyces noursei]
MRLRGMPHRATLPLMADPFLAALDQATRTVVARVRGELPAVMPAGAVASVSDAISHYYCCAPDRALCGLDLKEAALSGDGDQECVVCVDLNALAVHCPDCASGRNAV